MKVRVELETVYGAAIPGGEWTVLNVSPGLDLSYCPDLDEDCGYYWPNWVRLRIRLEDDDVAPEDAGVVDS